MLMMAGTENCNTSFGILAVPKELRRSEFRLDISAPNVAKKLPVMQKKSRRVAFKLLRDFSLFRTGYSEQVLFFKEAVAPALIKSLRKSFALKSPMAL